VPLYSHSLDALVPSNGFIYIDAAQISVTDSMCHVIATHSCGVTSLRMRKLHGCKEITAAVLFAVCVVGVA
jgi:hypothetical protein